MLDVSSDEFKRSWKRQEQQAKGLSDIGARRMLLFYAVECGGKHQLMLREGCFMYSRMPNQYKELLHDIKRMLKELGLEEKCDFPVLQSEHGQSISPGQYQEMWRYGINFKNANEMGKLIEENMLKALQLLHELEGRKRSRI
ncbi:MAG TPA: hypothetical protein DCZ91_18110 [Lachnospiraceae bacterium]|nr:hypothetical protein [Lachnospiraceae bacterium]